MFISIMNKYINMFILYIKESSFIGKKGQTVNLVYIYVLRVRISSFLFKLNDIFLLKTFI